MKNRSAVAERFFLLYEIEFADKWFDFDAVRFTADETTVVFHFTEVKALFALAVGVLHLYRFLVFIDINYIVVLIGADCKRYAVFVLFHFNFVGQNFNSAFKVVLENRLRFVGHPYARQRVGISGCKNYYKQYGNYQNHRTVNNYIE